MTVSVFLCIDTDIILIGDVYTTYNNNNIIAFVCAINLVIEPFRSSLHIGL